MTLFPIAVSIMAGGNSTRMGHDKAYLDDGRGPVLERLARLGLTLEIPVFIVGRTAPASWPIPEVIFLPDAQPQQGPLGGLVTALNYAEKMICLACDFIALEREAITWLHAQASDHAHGFVVSHADGIEPLFAVYHQHCRMEAERRLQQGERALHRLITACAMPHITAPPWVVKQLQNINTPTEWKQFLQFQQLQQQKNAQNNKG